MTEREEPPYPAGGRAAADDDWREQTTPGLTPVPGPGAAPYRSSGYPRPAPGDADHQPTSYQPRYEQPGDGQAGYGRAPYQGYGEPGGPVPTTAPAYSNRPLPVRRPDGLAAAALLLAGIAAGVSLLLPWIAGSEQTGWTLLRLGFRDFGNIYRTGMWQPIAIILGGALLFVLGLVVLAPARAHRTAGLLALLVTAAVGAGLLVPLSAAHWQLSVFDAGFFCGIAVAVLGLIGSLKALLTGPRTANRMPAAY